MKKSKNTARYGAIAALVLILAAALALTACKPMFLQDIAGYVPVYSQVVGPEGGTVTDSRGASVGIPAGALAKETTITIATYEDGGGIYSSHGVTPFSGGGGEHLHLRTGTGKYRGGDRDHLHLHRHR